MRGRGERHGIRKAAARPDIERPAVRLRRVEARVLVSECGAERGPTSPQRHSPCRAERLRIVRDRSRIGVGAERRTHQVADPHATVHQPHLTERPHAHADAREHARRTDGRRGLDHFEREAGALRYSGLGGIPKGGGPTRTERGR